MFSDPFVLTAFYAALALFALLGTIKRPLKCELGIVLFVCWAVSNVIFWRAPEYRAALYPLIDVAFMLTAARVGLLVNSKVPMALIALSVLSIAFSAAVSISGGLTEISLPQVYRYELGTNLIFIAQCLITGGWGLDDRLGWVGHIVGRARHRRGTTELPVSSQRETPE